MQVITQSSLWYKGLRKNSTLHSSLPTTEGRLTLPSAAPGANVTPEETPKAVPAVAGGSAPLRLCSHFVSLRPPRAFPSTSPHPSTFLKQHGPAKTKHNETRISTESIRFDPALHIHCLLV